MWESARGEFSEHEELGLGEVGGGLSVRTLARWGRTDCGTDQDKDFCFHSESNGKSSVMCLVYPLPLLV